MMKPTLPGILVTLLAALLLLGIAFLADGMMR